LHQQTHQGVRLDFILVKFCENFEKKFLVQIQLILIFFLISILLTSQYEKSEKKNPNKKKQNINQQATFFQGK
jgi:preprotein translocase subunit SecG